MDLIENIITKQNMDSSQSKLMMQLGKESQKQKRSNFDQERLDEIFSTISKIEPKNLLLVQFLILAIQKGLIKNSYPLSMFAEMFQQVKDRNPLQTIEQFQNNKHNQENEQSKFHKTKFIRLLKLIGKKMHPGDPMAYQTIIYQKIAGIDYDDHRLKIDDTVRKILNPDTIETLKSNQKYLQAIFQVYMPQNYNSRMGFRWQQIKLLQKRIPIMCILRFMHEAEIIPQIISPSLFFETCSKTIPPLNTNHKEVMFYYSETMSTYMRDFIMLPQIRIPDGDIGLNFLQFQILFAKLATDFAKDSKQEFSLNIPKLINFINIKELLHDPKSTVQRQTRFVLSVKSHLAVDKKAASKISVKKRQSRKKIEDLFDFNDQKFDSEFNSSQFDSVHLSPTEVDSIRKVLNDQLPPLPQKQVIQKENVGFYDLKTKHIVIGEQLPKIQQKNKPNQPKDPKKGKQDQLLGYKPETAQTSVSSTDQFANLIKRNKKIRINNQFPIILSEVLYPSSIPSLNLTPSSQIYLETAYIHVGERLFQQAFLNFRKAKSLIQSKPLQGEIFFDLLEAQIFESAGKDQAALHFYNKAKQLSYVLPNNETFLKALVYTGLGSCLYHLQQYEFSLRCFIKAANIRGKQLETESIENAIVQNNIGCCLMMLNRNNEAIRKFDLSEKVFDIKVGKFDERTLVVQQNQNKNKKAYIQMMPSFKTMWKAYVQKSNTKPAPKAKAKPKK